MRLKEVLVCSLLLFLITSSNISYSQKSKVNVLVLVQEFRNDNGSLYISVFDGEDGYPSDEEKAVVKAKLRIINGRVDFEFQLEPGEYAISVMHDENDNEEMDTNFIGIPKEGVGASNGAQGFMGPPSFKDAKFVVKSTPVSLIVNVKYF